MSSRSVSTIAPDRRLSPSAWWRAVALCCLATCLGACTVVPGPDFSSSDIPPLMLDGKRYSFEDALALPEHDVLATNEAMREFVRTSTRSSSNPQSRLMALHYAIKSPGNLALQYDPFADGDARTVFRRGSANCLSYAHLFVAFAREAGLEANYQWVEIRPEWQRLGERVAVRLHVNVRVDMRDGSDFVVDIDPLSRMEVAGTRQLSDEEGLALHYSNLAMQSLAKENPAGAWLNLVRGLAVAPDFSHLWVNLGAIYRYTGQYAEAEQVWFRALDIDKSDRSAMNNLMVLYESQGRSQEQDFWRERLERYRDLNPYYHAGLGDDAMAAGEWDAAVYHYSRARRIQPEDSQLAYNLGLAEYRRGNDRKAERLIRKAIELSAFEVEKERYRVQLRSIREQQAAAL